jgi:hypothetical protein
MSPEEANDGLPPSQVAYGKDAGCECALHAPSIPNSGAFYRSGCEIFSRSRYNIYGITHFTPDVAVVCD